MRQSEKTTQLLLEGYRKMSGDKKVKIGLSLSEAVRQVRKKGALDTHSSYGIKPSKSP